MANSNVRLDKEFGGRLIILNICIGSVRMKKVTLDMVINTFNTCQLGFDISDKELNVSLTSLGMDSIGFVNLIVAIEEEFECEIPDSKLLISEMDTVEKILNVLKLLYIEKNTIESNE